MKVFLGSAGVACVVVAVVLVDLGSALVEVTGAKGVSSIGSVGVVCSGSAILENEIEIDSKKREGV